MFRYDTHVHSSEVSACATNDVKKMIHKYIDLGYSGFILTNHFFNGNSCIPQRLSWERKVELFLDPYIKAKAICTEMDFEVFFGWEYNHYGTEFLTYGLDEHFLLSNPDILRLSLEEYARLVHDNGGILVHAHPFREAYYIDEIRLFPEFTDAVEAVNGAQTDYDYNEKATEYAKKHRLPMTAGSDAHYVSHSRFCGMEFEKRIDSIEGFITAIKNSEGSLFVI